MSESTMIARRGGDGEVAGIPHTLGSAYALCEQLAKLGDAIPKPLRGEPGKIMAVVKAGAELGIPPMRAMNSIYLYDGNVIMGAHLMAGLAQSHPDCDMFLVTDGDEEAIAEVRRRSWPDGKVATFRYTMDQARKAGLANKAMWKAHPAAMLRARVTGIAARSVFADIMAGVYTKDEGREMADRAQARPMQDARPASQRPSSRPPQPDGDVVDGELVSAAPAEAKPAGMGAAARLRDMLKREDVPLDRLNTFLRAGGKPELPDPLTDADADAFGAAFFPGGLSAFRLWSKANPEKPTQAQEAQPQAGQWSDDAHDPDDEPLPF